MTVFKFSFYGSIFIDADSKEEANDIFNDHRIEDRDIDGWDIHEDDLSDS